MSRVASALRLLPPDDPQRGWLLVEMAAINADGGRHELAYRQYEQALAAGDEQGRRDLEIASLKGIASLHRAAGRLEEAALLYARAVGLEERDAPDVVVGATWLDIAGLYVEADELRAALQALQRGEELFRRGGHVRLRTRALLQLGEIQRRLGQLDSARAELVRALVAAEALDDDDCVASVLLSLARTAFLQEDLVAARHYLDRVEEVVAEEDLLRGEVLLTRARMQHHEGDLAASAATISCALAATASTSTRLRQLDFGASVAGELGEHQRAAELLRAMLSLQEGYRRDEAFRRIEEARVRNEHGRTMEVLRDALDEVERLRSQLAEKRRELTEVSLALSRKDRFLDEVRRRLEELPEAAGTAPIESGQPLIDRIDEHASGDEAWQLFEQQFDETHRGFMRTLAGRHPGLTPSEIRVCLLTRMDLTTKEIASALHVSNRSIENHRYRIRKKLNLETGESLGTYLKGL